ncbi:MAG: alpha/beta hydrolase [Nevskia sp.]
MNSPLSLRARLFGPVSQWLLQPIMAKPAAQLRPQLERVAGLITRVPFGVKISRTNLAGVPADELVPKQLASDTVVLYLHGGAYLGGSPLTHRGLLAHLARAAGCRVIAIDYRLAPEHPYPAALNDALTSYKALLARRLKPEDLVLAGDSAGGNLALVTALALRDAGVPLPAKLILLSPWTDMTSSGDSFASRAARERILDPVAIPNAARTFAGGLDLADPRLSPLFAELRGLPPMLIQVGDDELLLADSSRLANAAHAAQVPVTLQIWPGLWHVWQVLAGWMPEADRAIAQMADFIRLSLR